MSKKRVLVRVLGRVQGVYYRGSTEQRARELGVHGWVRNLPDGSVEIQAEGDVLPVDTLIAWAHRGPAGARVHSVKVVDQEFIGDLQSFDVHR